MSKRIVGHTKEDVATLPRWAQSRIKSLTEEVERQRELLSKTPPGATNVTIVDGMNETGLPPGSKIRFRLGHTQVEVGHQYKNDLALDIRSLDGALSIFPQVTNVICVRVTR
jgi:hypothetical protein